MSTFNPYNTATNTLASTASPSHYHSTPENIRSIFFTNLFLLGVQEYSSQQSEGLSFLPNHSLDLSKSRNDSQIPPGTASQPQQHILIDSHSYGVNVAKPLELHKHVFAKGHQSTKALEFVLWFLLTRLDKTQARERFKECWPILDRHDAREFRNVTFKWLDELRKEGCFGIGHNIRPSQGQTTGLGVFLPTIRRSYLDESIGERIEQLVLILSTYVLSRAIVREDIQSIQEEDKLIFDLISVLPETAVEEDTMLTELDSQIVTKSQLFIRDMVQQREIRRSWSSLSSEMAEKLHILNKELTKIEAERRTFLTYQPQLAERTNQLTLSELRVLEDRWIEKINTQWQPILTYVERRVGRKEVLQSLLDSDTGKGDSVLNGQAIHMDLPVTLRHLAENVVTKSYGDPKVDLNSILEIWKRSLQTLDGGEVKKVSNVENVVLQYKGSLEILSANHGHQLEKLQELKRRLGTRLKESSRRIDRLQREQKIKQQPYLRLLSTLPIDIQGGDLFGGTSSTSAKEINRDALTASKLISASLQPTPADKTLLNARLSAIKTQTRKSADRGRHRGLESNLNLSGIKDASNILQVRAPAVVSTRPTRSQPSDSISQVPAMKSQLLPKEPTVSKIPTATHKSSESEVAFSRSIIRPPPSILARVTKKPSNSATSIFTATNRILTPERPSIKPVPADLAMRGHLRGDEAGELYDAACDEIISSLSSDTPASMTPPRPKASTHMPSPHESDSRGKSYLISGTYKPTATGTITSGKFQSSFLASIFQGDEHSRRADKMKQNSQITSMPTDPERVNMSHTKAASVMADTTSNVPPATGATISSFQERLGISRKRRQSSEFLREHEEVHQPATESEVIQQKELFNIFNVDDNEVLRTPSKRRKVDSFSQHLSSHHSPFRFDIEVPTKGDGNRQSGFLGLSSIAKSPDTSPKKVMSSSKLTLNDLRALTPKPLKTSSTTLPIMFLHTPQRKQLFPMEASPVSKSFPSLNSPSASNVKSDGQLASPKLSLERSPFSSSIFSRFKAGVSLSLSDKSQLLTSDPLGLAARHQPGGEASLFSTSLTSKMGTISPKKTSIHRRPSRPLNTSAIRNLLSGDSSVVLDRLGSEGSKQPNSTTVIESQTKAKSDMSDSKNPDIPVNRSSSGNNKMAETPKAVLRGSVAASSSVDLNAKRNPWGRPPSWKPKSPRMIDMERRRQLDRAHRLAAKDVGPMESSLDALALSSMGSLKVSVYGRASVSVPSSLSPSFSSSSISSRSFQSDFGLGSSRLYGASLDEDIHRYNGLGGERGMEESKKNNDESDEDTRRFSPPPVSPIRKPHPNSLRSLSASTMSISSPGDAKAVLWQLKNSNSSVQQGTSTATIATTGSSGLSETKGSTTVTVASAVPPNRPFVTVKSTEGRHLSGSIAELSKAKKGQQQQSQEAAKRQFLEDAIQDEELIVGGDEEDETILNHALQPIFTIQEGTAGGSSNRSEVGQRGQRHLMRSVQSERRGVEECGGLFDEVMPDALDLDEALWENTELFS
ncbi:hypothetical protein BGX27_009524 [Mortierella sp. AM989]|nr:hypothetical protein BGX27_009524 [Mortierella sp. AM989]